MPQVKNATVTQSSDGTQIITLILDYSDGGTDLVISLGGPLQTRPIPVLTVFADLDQVTKDFILTSQNGGETPRLIIKGNTSGFYPCYYSAPVNITAHFTGGGTLTIQLLSKLIPGPVWPSTDFATSVWAAVPRTLTADPFSAAGALLVWASPVRSLTADPAIYTDIAAIKTAPAGTILDLRPGAGLFRRISVNTATNCSPGIYDGVNFGASIDYMVGSSVRGPAVSNAGGVNQTIFISGADQV